MSAIFSTPPPGCTCCINNEVYEETPCPPFANKLVVSIEEVDPPIVSCCNICLEPLAFTGCEHLTRDRAVTLNKCGHVFGHTYLDKWLEDATTCPMCRVEVKESMEWLKNAFIGSVFGAAGLREELEHVMVERTLQMRNLMTPESMDEDGQDGDDIEGSDEEIDKEESDKEEERGALEKEEARKPEGESETCIGLDVVRRIVA